MNYPNVPLHIMTAISPISASRFWLIYVRYGCRPVDWLWPMARSMLAGCATRHTPAPSAVPPHLVPCLRSDGEKSDLLLPTAALPLLSKILREIGHGKNVVVLTTDTEVTTQQAAEFLTVSRPYFVKLLEEGKIPFRLVDHDGVYCSVTCCATRRKRIQNGIAVWTNWLQRPRISECIDAVGYPRFVRTVSGSPT